MPETNNVMLTERQLAQRWSIARGSLANDRFKGRGLAYVKIGQRVRYRMTDVLAFEEANRVAFSEAA